jgi:NadR type nicotinamide-nucleotide adenylyltransferase
MRVAVIGAECTGKTALCEQIAAAFGTVWVPEYLREFVDARARAPLAIEQREIIHEQIKRERAAIEAAQREAQPLVAFDSAPLVTALYSRIYFDDDRFIAAAIAHHRSYDVTLVTDIDLPWLADGVQRDSAAVRARFHAELMRSLDAEAIAYDLVRGSGETRFDRGMAVVRATLATR